MGYLLAILIPAITIPVGGIVSPSYTPPETGLYFCAGNLLKLGEIFVIYVNEHDGKLPRASQWWDALQEYNLEPRVAKCPADASRTIASSYGFNESLDGLKINGLDRNTVLLFEIEGGPLNISGGPEIMCEDKHGTGSNVLFVDGRVRFIKKDNKHKLKWHGEMRN